MRFWKRRKQHTNIEFDEILLDSSNLPSFDTTRLEGRIELPLSRGNFFAIVGIFFVIALVFSGQLIKLQVIEGAEHARVSEENRLAETIVVAERGPIYDRHGELLAYNELDTTGQYDFPVRAYTDRTGLGQLIGYVSYPQKDRAGFYYRTEYVGRTGVELAFHEHLEGENGKQLIEVSATGEIISENVVTEPTSGDELQLTVDAELSEYIYETLASTTGSLGFRSGAAAIMDARTGEIVAMTSFPSYDPEVLSDGDDGEEIEALNNDERFPFLNKIIGGMYTPGSIVKPFVAYAALVEGVISPERTLYSNGSITIPNPYDPDNPSEFSDWRAHGQMTIRDGIAFSSNVFFYILGGGLPEIAVPQAGLSEPFVGLGISRLHEYFTRFGLGEETGIGLQGELGGTVPNPAWKREVFDDDWRLGDTYFTSIGQYGFSITPLQMLRAYAAIANGGTLVTPHLVPDGGSDGEDIELDQDALRVVQDGMRRTVTQAGGTARPLERSDVAIAAKSGTAEVGEGNRFVNSWVAGYFPHDEPRYAFILFMERGPRENTLGAGRVMGWIFDWIAEHRPEMLSS